MSGIFWKENTLFQRVGNDEEELGFIGFNVNSEIFVLWLKNTCDLLGPKGGFTRGDEFPSLEAAKRHAATSRSASIYHHVWMMNRGKVRKRNWHAIIEGLKRRFGEVWSKYDREIIKVTIGTMLGSFLTWLFSFL